MNRRRCKVCEADIRVGRHLPVRPRATTPCGGGLVASDACGRRRHAQHRAGRLRQVPLGGGLLFQSALEAVVADSNPIAVLPRRVPGRAGHRVGCAPGTEHAAAVAAVVAPIQNCELDVAVVAHPAALVGHPKIPRQVMRLRPRRGWRRLLTPPRHPRLHHAEQLHQPPIR
jgi:hypothetical protein